MDACKRKSIVVFIAILLFSKLGGGVIDANITALSLFPELNSVQKEDKSQTENKKTEIGITILESIPYGSPIKEGKVITSSYGMRLHPILKLWKKHEGIDIGARHGTKVTSTSYGRVISAKYERGYGNTVRIQSGEYELVYAHLSAVKVKKGERVQIGQEIGLVGSTGLSTGPHLHYEVRIGKKSQNPMPYIKGEL